MIYLVPILVGTVVGGVVGHFGKCHSGMCPLTSTPLRGAIYGGFMGLLWVLLRNP